MVMLHLDGMTGALSRFPAGSYHAQTATREGEAELAAMQATLSSYQAFSKPLDELTSDQIKFRKQVTEWQRVNNS